MITTIIFDYGGVITADRRSRCFSEWACAKYGVSKTIVNSLFDSEHFNQYMRGKIDKQEFFSRFQEIGVTTDIESMSQQLVTYNEPVTRMKNLLDSLSRRYDLCLISDSTPELTKDVRKKFKHIFRVFIFSDERGYVKDDQILYDIAFSEIGADPKRCIYIDDKEEKLEYPRSKGVIGIHFRGVDLLMKTLAKACGESPYTLAHNQ